MDVQAFPRVRRGEIETVGTGMATLWVLKTEHPLEVVLAPGFFGAFGRDRGMSEHDRILATCNIGSGEVTHADLIVTQVIAPARGNADAGIKEVKPDVVVRVLRLEAPSPASRRAA